MVLIVVVVVAVLVPMQLQRREEARRINCRGNLKSICLALIIYAGDDVDDGFFPSGHDFGLLNELSYLVDGKVYVCPSDTQPGTFATNSSFKYIASGLKDTNKQAQTTPVVYCDIHTGWVNIGYLDGHVKGQKTLPTDIVPPPGR